MSSIALLLPTHGPAEEAGEGILLEEDENDEGLDASISSTASSSSSKENYAEAAAASVSMLSHRKLHEKNENKDEEKEDCCFEVVIVGAGAAGLTCAHTLIKEHGLKPQEILILEARDRVGGRICTIPQATGEGPGEECVARDLGAAWVHGTHLDSAENPILPLLRQSTINRTKRSSSCRRQKEQFAKSRGVTASPSCDWSPRSVATTKSTTTTISSAKKDPPNLPTTSDDNDDDLLTFTSSSDPILRQMLEPVLPGNPWMRPKTILHDHGGIALYVQQQQQSSSQQQHSTSMMIQPDSNVISEALKDHFSILRGVSDKVTSLFAEGKGMETMECSLGECLEEISSSLRQQEEVHRISMGQQQEESTRQALTGLYQHLITCWYGRSLFDIQMGYFESDNNPHDSEKEDDDASFTANGDFDGPHCTVRDGMHQLLKPLLHEFDLQNRCIRLNQHVMSIFPAEENEHDDEEDSSCSSLSSSLSSSIVVETAQGRRVYGKACVVTLPIGCLRHDDDDDDENDGNSSSKKNSSNNIFATKPLSMEKRQAIQQMKMGTYKKVFLTFDRIFWDPGPAFLGLVLDHQHVNHDDDEQAEQSPLGNYLLLNNLWKDKPCVEAILVGDQGTWATGKSDDAIQSAVLDFMQQTIMSSSHDNDNIKDWCVSCHVTRWEEDPWSRGAYSSWSLGALPRHAQELSRPEWNNRLYFAGEATNEEFEGSVHAALISGKDAASKVSDFLASKPSTATARSNRHKENNKRCGRTSSF